MDIFLSLRDLGCVQPLRHWLDGGNAREAKRLIEESCEKQDILSGQLTLHADRGRQLLTRSQLISGHLPANAKPKGSDQGKQAGTLRLEPATDLEEEGGHSNSVQPARRPSETGRSKRTEKGAKDDSRIRGDVGPRVLRYVAELMQIDANWCVAEKRSITWWGHTLSQRIWADPFFVEDGDEIVRVHAEADFLRNVSESSSIPKLLSELNRDAALSGYMWNPGRRIIKLHCSAFVHSRNVEWLECLFAWAVAIQAAEAHSLAESLAMRLGAEIDTSAHPKNGPRNTPDEILGLTQFLANSHSKNTRAFTSEDFKNASHLGPKPWVMANAGENGFTADFPFPGCVPPTALFTAENHATHPRLGVGLLLLLRLPMFCSSGEAEALAVKLNSAELINMTRTHFMGGWSVGRQRNKTLIEKGVVLQMQSVSSVTVNERASSTLSFCAFLPSVVRQPSVFPNLVFSMAYRARWANEFLGSENGAPELLGPRDRHSYDAQREEHRSAFGKLGRRIKHQPKRKPN
jgi:hypothetical protein